MTNILYPVGVLPVFTSFEAVVEFGKSANGPVGVYFHGTQPGYTGECPCGCGHVWGSSNPQFAYPQIVLPSGVFCTRSEWDWASENRTRAQKKFMRELVA